MSKVEILGVKIDAITDREALSKLLEFSKGGRSKIICTPNTEFVMTAQTDEEFLHILNTKSSLNLADGFGILWAAKFNTFSRPKTKVLREIIIVLQWIFSIILIPIYPNFFTYPIPQRLSGSDFIYTISHFAAKNKLRVFLLGGAATVAERTALVLQTAIYDLKICGVYSGKAENVPEIVEMAKNSKVDILLVAFGAPKQEKWLVSNLSKTGAKIGIGLGGTFDFVSGAKSRAPKWMRKSGLEWLYRLFCNPRRLGRQMSLPKFMYRILVNRLKNE